MEPSSPEFECIAELAEALKGQHEGGCISLQGSGITLLDGTLEMLEHACIVFDDCSNVTFSGITFTGGLVVCRGTNCDVTFNACNFDGCKLVAMEEAQVHLVDSLLEASMSDIGLLARGEGTVVDAQNCIIMNGIQSASAQDGACIILQDCSCSGATVVGVEVRGEGAIIKIQGSFVGDMKGAGKVTTSAPTTPTVASVATGTPTGGTPTRASPGTGIRAPLSPGIWSTETPTTAAPPMTKPRAHSGAGVPSKLIPGSTKPVWAPITFGATAAAHSDRQPGGVSSQVTAFQGPQRRGERERGDTNTRDTRTAERDTSGQEQQGQRTNTQSGASTFSAAGSRPSTNTTSVQPTSKQQASSSANATASTSTSAAAAPLPSSSSFAGTTSTGAQSSSAATAAATATTTWTGKSVRTHYHGSTPPRAGVSAAAGGLGYAYARTPPGARTPPQCGGGGTAAAAAAAARPRTPGHPRTPGTAGGKSPGALSSNNAGSRSSSAFSETTPKSTTTNNRGASPRGASTDHTPTSAAMISSKTQQPFQGAAVTAAQSLMHDLARTGSVQTRRAEKPMDEATAACGILVHSGSSITIESTTIKRCLYGVWIDGAELRAQGCEILECGGSCMEVKHAGSAVLRKCTLSGAMRKHGIGVHGSGSSAQLKGCKMQNNKECGALVTKGAKITADGCQTGGNNAGFWTQEQGILTITQCLSNRDIAGAGASSGGKLTAETLTAERATGDGVRVFNGGIAELKKCALLRCNQDGAWVNGTGSILRVDATGIRENVRFGVLVEKGGDVTCEGVKSWGNKEGGFGCAARSFMSLRRCISRKETAYEVDPSAKMFFEVCQPSSNKGFFKRRA